MFSVKNNERSFQALSSKEWLVTNGIGGYAASSIIGANTRRYHGLLVAALDPPTRRTVLVSRVEECIYFNRDCAFGLSSNQYPGAVFPKGFQYFKFFERKPLPRMKFEAAGNHLLKTVFMVPGSNTTVVEYENTGNVLFKLRLTPLFAHRDYHSLGHESPDSDFYLTYQNGAYCLYAHYGATPLYFNFSSGEFIENRNWYKNSQYVREQERGLDFQEDCYAVANIDVVLKPGAKVHLLFSTDETMVRKDPDVLKSRALQHLETLSPKHQDDPFLRDLHLAADQFVVRRTSTDGYTLLAGYHWFTDWGRDTMIAMRGLTIATGRQDVSRSILETFLKYVDGGMLPNRFPDQGESPEYNTIDATLWLFIALYEYYQKFRDIDLIKKHFDTLTDILEKHIAGTRYNIHVTPEGFLYGGKGLAQLTWMDARVGDYVVTPRHGCPVEIQALWFNALRIYQYFAGTLEKPFESYKALADRLEGNFKKYFLRPNGSLNDVVNPAAAGTVADSSMRPNQIYAVSLPFTLLDRDAEKQVVENVRKQLLTGYGLRTLAPEHPEFKPVYAGTPWERDTAYHQGTVWPFLLGEYITAFLKVEDWSEQAQQEARTLLEPLKQHFYQDDCIFGISEIFDGATPGAGKGTVQQAWSVGALLKSLLELEATRKKGRRQPTVPYVALRPAFF